MSLRHTPASGKLQRMIRRYCGAFTLIEMLVVLAIIGMLAGMLLPALAKARENGRRAVCTSNLDQIGKTLHIYTSATDDYLPSWACYGSLQATVSNSPNGGPYGAPSNQPLGWTPISNCTAHQAPSRHMVVGCSFEFPGTPGTPPNWGPSYNCDILPRLYSSGNPTPLALGEPAANFVPVGLGILVARNYLTDVKVLDCPSMKAGAITYYNWDGVQNHYYTYDPGQWKKLAGQNGSPEQMFLTGDGTSLYQTGLPDGNYAIALLSSYSYRDTPFYYDTSIDDGTGPWVSNNTVQLPGKCLVPLDSTNPQIFPQFMTPAFKTHRALKDRAICCDSFDYAPQTSSGFALGGGLAMKGHVDGYNVLYGDGHVKWYDDTDHQISNFTRWNSSYTVTLPGASTTSQVNVVAGVDDLTIASPTSQLVWNLFDRTMGIDVGQ